MERKQPGLVLLTPPPIFKELEGPGLIRGLGNEPTMGREGTPSRCLCSPCSPGTR